MQRARNFHRIASLWVLGQCATACVTTHVGDPIKLKSIAARVSCAYGQDIRTDSVSGIVCSIENQSQNWLDLRVKSLEFPQQSDVKITGAGDLKILAEAYRLKQQQADNNVGIALTSLVLAGAVVGLTGKTQTTKALGEVAMAGGLATAAVRETKKGYDEAQYGPAVYSSDHILAGSLRLPPEMSLRKQLVVEHPTARPKEILICWDQPAGECSRVPLEI